MLVSINVTNLQNTPYALSTNLVLPTYTVKNCATISSAVIKAGTLENNLHFNKGFLYSNTQHCGALQKKSYIAQLW